MADNIYVSSFKEVFSRLAGVGFLEKICGFFASNIFNAHREDQLSPNEERVFYELLGANTGKYGLKLPFRKIYI